MKRIDVDQAQRLMQRGALVIDVLPSPTYVSEHLPSAINIPLSTLDERKVENLDRDQPLIVYCYDQRCDLSARASARFEQLGFTAVHDLIGGRAAWTVLGLATEGEVGDRRRIVNHLRPVPSVPIGSTIADVRALEATTGPVAVVDDDGVLLGALDEQAAELPPSTPVDSAMTLAPGTLRPELRLDEALQQLRDDGLAYSFVTTARGQLLGLLCRDQHV